MNDQHLNCTVIIGNFSKEFKLPTMKKTQFGRLDMDTFSVFQILGFKVFSVIRFFMGNWMVNWSSCKLYWTKSSSNSSGTQSTKFLNVAKS